MLDQQKKKKRGGVVEKFTKAKAQVSCLSVGIRTPRLEQRSLTMSAHRLALHHHRLASSKSVGLPRATNS